MEFVGIASLVASGVWFVVGNFISGYKEFKRETRSRITTLEQSVGGDHCSLKHLELKEDVMKTIWGE